MLPLHYCYVTVTFLLRGCSLVHVLELALCVCGGYSLGGSHIRSWLFAWRYVIVGYSPGHSYVFVIIVVFRKLLYPSGVFIV